MTWLKMMFFLWEDACYKMEEAKSIQYWHKFKLQTLIFRSFTAHPAGLSVKLNEKQWAITTMRTHGRFSVKLSTFCAFYWKIPTYFMPSLTNKWNLISTVVGIIWWMLCCIMHWVRIVALDHFCWNCVWKKKKNNHCFNLATAQRDFDHFFSSEQWEKT